MTPTPHPIRRDRRPLGTAGAMAVLALTVAGCAGTGPAVSTDDTTDPQVALHEAIATARAQVAAHPDDVDARWRLALSYERAAADALALAHSDTVLGLDPDHFGALSLWSKLQFEVGAHETAVQRLEATRARHGELPETLRAGLALHYDALGRWEESAREFDDVKTPTSAKVYHVLRSDDFMDAAALAAAALEREPESAASHNNYGITQLYAGEPETAHAAFLRALELDPDLAGAMYNLAIVETFYFFDEAAGRDWFAAYRATGAVDDPDGLAATFAWDDTSPVGRQALR